MSNPSEAEAPTAPQKVQANSIVFYLVAIALMTLIPSFLFSGILLQRNNEAQQEIVHTLTVATTRSLNDAVDREISGMITTLKVLSTSPTLDAGDLASFHQRTQAALEGTGEFLILVDGNYQQLLNTRVAFGTALPKTSDPGPVQQVIDSGNISVSDIFFGAVSQKLVFNVLLPRIADNGSRQVLLLTRNAEDMLAALSSSELPDGWNAALLDGTGTVAATTDPNLRVGQPYFLDLSDASVSTGWWMNGQDKDDRFAVIRQRSGLTGWSVVAWAPAAVVNRPLLDSMIWLVAGCVIMGIVVLVGLSWISSQIARSVTGLMVDARRLGQGETVTAKAYPVREIAEVSAEIAGAARKRLDSENEIRFLMRELAHRAKNQLSVINAMAKQTAHTAISLDVFLADFQKRILGLARSTDLLLNFGASGIGLTDLVEAHLQPFRPEEPDRLHIEGPRVRVHPEAAQSLGMALHEMSTNATKYGAFAGDDGRLDVSWRWQNDMLAFTWRESGVTLIERPERRGFGTTVIEKLLASTLSAKVEKTMHADGIEWSFQLPADSIVVGSSPPTPEAMAANASNQTAS